MRDFDPEIMRRDLRAIIRPLSLRLEYNGKTGEASPTDIGLTREFLETGAVTEGAFDLLFCLDDFGGVAPALHTQTVLVGGRPHEVTQCTPSRDGISCVITVQPSRAA